jgi:thiamine pyrophosphate-dependent acetolactate synthase large subunit-like protein
LKARTQKDNALRSTFAERWKKRQNDRMNVERRQATACGSQQPMDPRWVLHELNGLLPSDAIVVEETITDREA